MLTEALSIQPIPVDAYQEELLTLDPKHPGLNDQLYNDRRNMFYNSARKHRLCDLGLPDIEYTAEENAIWQHVSEKLIEAHEKSACSMYLKGKKLLGLESQFIPSLLDLDAKLQAQHGIRLTPAEGLIPARDFFGYLSNRIMPCTQYIRHGSNPEYTPEPDAVHDVIGHVPPLMDKDYGELIQLIGKGVRQATDEQITAWERLYWFTIEFGLIEEQGEIKVFGAGILSSFGEMEYCFSDKVDRRPLNLDEIVNLDYDPTQMQDTIFVIPSIRALIDEVKSLIAQCENEKSNS